MMEMIYNGNTEPKLTPRLKAGDRVYYKGRLMAIVSHSGHRRMDNFSLTGLPAWIPLYELAPATLAGNARKRARTKTVLETDIIKPLNK